MFTMRPPCRRMGRARRRQLKTPVRLVRRTSFQSSSVIFLRVRSRWMPALLTRMSRPPRRWRTWSIQVAAMMDQVRQRLGGLDILVNNAGILRDRTLKKITDDDWNDVLRTNLTGVFNCLRRALPILRQGGRIVNIASVAAYLGVFGQANYASAKAGVIALTKVAARELARQSITVNAVAPGVIDTDMTRALTPEALQHLMNQIPLARFGAIDDVVNAVTFLASPAS